MSAVWRDQLILEWVDRYGRDWSTYHTLADQSSFDDSPFAAFMAAMEAASHATIAGATLSRVKSYTGAPSSGPYDSVKENALLQCRSTTNRLIRQRIPAPLATLFMPDTETVDITDSLLIAVETEAAALLADASGNAFATIRRGKRVQVF